MQGLDLRSIVLGSVYVMFMLSISLLMLYRTIPRKLPGLIEGVYGGACYSFGALLVLLRNVIPNFFSITVANTMLTGASVFICMGILKYYEVRVKSGWPKIGVILVFGSLWVADVFGKYSDELIFITLINSATYLTIVLLLKKFARLNSIIFFLNLSWLLAFFMSGLRLVTVVMSVDSPTNFYDPSLIQRLYGMYMAFNYDSIVLLFILLTYSKLRAILLDANVSLKTQVEVRTTELMQEIETRKTLEQHLGTLIDTERRRIGYELHDDLGQQLTGISLIAEVLARELSSIAPALCGYAENIGTAASAAILQVRKLAHGLLPVAPEPEGFCDALQLLTSNLSTPGLVCEFQYDYPIEIKNQNLATNLFRIAQEGVNNSIKHAHANKIIVRLDRLQNKIHLCIIDDGCGFTQIAPDVSGAGTVGNGLGIMAIRASYINFSLVVDSCIGKGTTLRISEC